MMDLLDIARRKTINKCDPPWDGSAFEIWPQSKGARAVRFREWLAMGKVTKLANGDYRIPKGRPSNWSEPRRAGYEQLQRRLNMAAPSRLRRAQRLVDYLRKTGTSTDLTGEKVLAIIASQGNKCARSGKEFAEYDDEQFYQPLGWHLSRKIPDGPWDASNVEVVLRAVARMRGITDKATLLRALDHKLKAAERSRVQLSIAQQHGVVKPRRATRTQPEQSSV